MNYALIIDFMKMFWLICVAYSAGNFVESNFMWYFQVCHNKDTPKWLSVLVQIVVCLLLLLSWYVCISLY